MLDQHFKASSYEDLAAFLTAVNGVFHVKHTNILGPRQGVAAVEAYTDEEGYHEAVPAKGDPAYWYASVRHNGEEITTEGGVEVSDEETNVSVLGVWAS